MTTQRATSELGLHFDLTVPFARYVLEHAGHLEFPFRRYQIQPAWRGERPQEGRYRQFNQADVDIVGRDVLPFHHDVEVMRVMVDALDALPIPPVSFQFNNRKLIQGFYRGLGLPDVTAAIRTIDKLDKLPENVVADLLRVRRRRHPRAGRAVPRARDDPGARHVVRRPGAGARRDRRPPRGRSRRARGRRRGLRRRRPRQRHGGGQPADRPRARLLHRHRGRDLHGGLRAAEVRRRRRPVRRPRQRRQDDVPRRRGLVRRLPHARPAGRRRGARRQPVGAERRARRRRRRGVRDPRPTPSPARCAPAASRARSHPPPRSSASRSGTPTAAASPTSGSHHRPDGAPPTRSRTSAAETRCRPTRPPGTLLQRTCDPRSSAPHRHHRGDKPVIRTHDAGALRAEHVGQTVTLAGWVANRRDHGGVAFLDLRDASGVVQVVIRDEAIAHALRSEYCLKVTGEVDRPQGRQREPQPPHRRDRGRRRRASRCSSRGRAAAVPDRRPRRRGGGGAAQAPLPRPASYGARRRPAAAQQGQPGRSRRPRRARLRRDRDADADPQHPRGRPRLPGARAAPARQLVRPPAEPAAVQAAAHGRRHGALLPDRALLPRRGLPRRPPARVHPARRRDELRRAGRRARALRGDPGGAVAADRPRRPAPDPADHLRRRDGPLRLRQARPADGSGAGRVHRLLQGHARSGCSRRRTSAPW